MFDPMEIVEVVYEGGALSKNTQLESECDSSGRNKKEGASTSPSNLEQGRPDKRKRSNAGHPSDEPTGAKNTCLLHGPGNSSKEYKFIREYTKKRSEQHTYKDKQARSGSNKRTKTVNFEDTTEEVNIMKYQDEPIPNKKRGEKQKLNPRVIRPMHTHQRMYTFMELTA